MSVGDVLMEKIERRSESSLGMIAHKLNMQQKIESLTHLGHIRS
jgi:hypothetical protein